MKKFLFDLTEVGKDVWLGFVWLVDAAGELGEIAGEKLAEFTGKRRTAKLTTAMPSIKRNCVTEE